MLASTFLGDLQMIIATPIRSKTGIKIIYWLTNYQLGLSPSNWLTKAMGWEFCHGECSCGASIALGRITLQIGVTDRDVAEYPDRMWVKIHSNQFKHPFHNAHLNASEFVHSNAQKFGVTTINKEQW